MGIRSDAGAVYLKPTDDENCGNDCQNLSLKIKNEIINIYKLSIHISVNSDKLKDKVFVRQRADGDRIVCRGMTRRVKKLLQCQKKFLLREGIYSGHMRQRRNSMDTWNCCSRRYKGGIF